MHARRRWLSGRPDFDPAPDLFGRDSKPSQWQSDLAVTYEGAQFVKGPPEAPLEVRVPDNGRVSTDERAELGVFKRTEIQGEQSRPAGGVKP